MKKIIVEGGILVPAKGSCGSEYEIEGGEIKAIELSIPEIRQIKLSGYKIDKAHNGMECIEFNDKEYWRMNTDPDAY